MNSIEELRYTVLAAQRDGNRIFSGLLKPSGLTPSRAEVLRVLDSNAPLSQRELGELLVCEQGSPSRLVDSLVEAGLVSRSAASDDRRRVELTLTTEGEKAAAVVAEVERQLHESIGSLISQESARKVCELLQPLLSTQPAGIALGRRLSRES